MIEKLRAVNTGATLLDNGDFLKGTPLAATLNAEETHPMIVAVNCLHYDAVTLGNHEFDYGVPYLRRAFGRLRAHFVSANIRCFDEPTLASTFRILTRDLACDDGMIYEIDLAQPTRFDVWGKDIAPSASLIRHIALNRRAVAAKDVFIVATNSFHASSSGGFGPIPQADIAWRTPDKLRDILNGSLQQRALITDAPHPVWRFRPIVGAHAQFQTAPQDSQHVAQAITQLGQARMDLKPTAWPSDALQSVCFYLI
jgi:2',3'-cyclic-nucleotide 2'-phosphodiesterase (5'-nucleotidase family)